MVQTPRSTLADGAGLVDQVLVPLEMWLRRMEEIGGRRRRPGPEATPSIPGVAA